MDIMYKKLKHFSQESKEIIDYILRITKEIRDYDVSLRVPPLAKRSNLMDFYTKDSRRGQNIVLQIQENYIQKQYSIKNKNIKNND